MGEARGTEHDNRRRPPRSSSGRRRWSDGRVMTYVQSGNELSLPEGGGAFYEENN